MEGGLLNPSGIYSSGLKVLYYFFFFWGGGGSSAHLSQSTCGRSLQQASFLKKDLGCGARAKEGGKPVGRVWPDTHKVGWNWLAVSTTAVCFQKCKGSWGQA